MSEPESVDDLDPRVRAALLADELVPGPSAGQRARMAARMAAAVGVPAAALVTGATATTAPASAPPSTVTSPSAPPLPAARLGLKAGLAIGVVLGGGLGVILGRTVFAPDRTAPPPVVERGPVVPAPIPSSVVPPDASPPIDAGAPGLAPPLDARAERTDAGPGDARAADAASTIDATILSADQVARERALLDAARAALRAGDLVLARRHLAEHQLRYPTGTLAEEREVLTIEELVQRGDRAAARARADQFALDHPRSIFAARVARLFSP
jgi:hypothetical protein